MGRSTHESHDTGRRRLADISVPKIRKVVHKVMTKNHGDPFYQKIDLIKKVLRKLKVHPVGCGERNKIRNLINRWISTNKPTDEDNADKKDVKKGIPKMDEEVTVNKEVTEKKTSESQVDSLEIVNQSTKSVQVSSGVVPTEVSLLSLNTDEKQTHTEDQSTEKSDVQISPEVLPIAHTTKVDAPVEAIVNSSEIKKEKIIPLIDLTILDADEIKKEPMENDEGSNTALESQVENAAMPEYNYNYYYGYPYNYNYNYNYDYNYYSWYHQYYNAYNQYNTNTNWNGVYTAPPVNYTNGNN